MNFLIVVSALALSQPPTLVSGYDSNNGKVLIGELGCISCHAPGAAIEHLTPKQAPILTDVGKRVTPQFLQAYLADPQKVKPGTPMPDLLHGIPAADKAKTVDLLTHYLVSLGGPIDQKSSGANRVQIERGQDVYHSIGCVACHAPFAAPPKHKRDPAAAIFDDDDDPKARKTDSPSVPLGDLALKTTVDALAKFLDDPLAVRPSGRMPHLPMRPGESRMIAAYLLKDQYTDKAKAPGLGVEYSFYEGAYKKVPDFDKLKPLREGVAKTFDLKAAIPPKKKIASNFAVRFKGAIDIPKTGKYRFFTHSDDGSVLRIDGKLVVDNDGIHSPSMTEGMADLTVGRHAIEVGFIQGGGGAELDVYWMKPGDTEKSLIPPGILVHESAGAMLPKGIVDFQVDAQKASEGRKLFASLGCASCHAVEGKSPDPKFAMKAPSLASLDVKKGCLAESPGKGEPRYALSVVQRKAVADAVTGLRQLKGTPDAVAKIDHAMTALNCFACHVRDKKGGPDKQRSDFFVYEVLVELGDEGRLPPPLAGVGAKLTKLGFEDALFSGKHYRSYMATRMPNFGTANVGHLPDLFKNADQGTIAKHEPAFNKQMVEDGRKMLGKTTLACINCHAWGNQRLPGAEGLDLLEVTRRIEPGWFQAWLLNPNKLRPGTRMPTAWPDGKSFFPAIQGGDTAKQIDAIWAHLSAGIKGGPPPGLGASEKGLLVPNEEPIVFRTFLDQVGAHSILVGFPQRLNLVFDANRVRSVQAWSGSFISTAAAWDGRAGQYAKVPSVELLKFPDGPTFTTLDSLTANWPGDAPKAKFGSSRTPAGWQYLGYRYDSKRQPIFMYSMPKVAIEEGIGIDTQKDGVFLTRRFELTAQEELPNLYFRVAVGKEIIQKDGAYFVDGQRWRLDSPASVRVVNNQSELLVPIRWNNKKATVQVAVTWQ